MDTKKNSNENGHKTLETLAEGCDKRKFLIL